jgi:dTDP-4-amino-4,6-dideoxygalactose transaminase
MRVSMLDTRAQYSALRADLLGAAERVLSSGQWIGGPEVHALEEEIAPLTGCRHAIAVASGTDALLLSLKALGVGPGVDVVVPTFTFFATAGAVANAGGRPVFADIEPAGMNLDPDSLARAVTERTRVVIPVDLFGQCPDYDAIGAICRSRGIAILEDAAQAIGSSLDGRPAGSLGDLAAFSFYPTKNLGACGDGGLITTNDASLAETVRRLAAHGSDGGYIHTVVGTNSRCDPLQAALLRAKLRVFERWQESRAANAAFYTSRLGKHPALICPATARGCRHVFHQYVIRVARGARDDLKAVLASREIATAIYYPLPLHLQECFAPLGGRPGDLPVAEGAARTCLALPIHPDLTPEQREYVAAEVLAWADRQA